MALAADPSLYDPPPQSRPWTSDFVARASAGPDVFWLFRVGEVVRCPRCSRQVAEFGAHVGAAIRLHPDQFPGRFKRYAPPTGPFGEARLCQERSCKAYLDLRFLLLRVAA